MDRARSSHFVWHLPRNAIDLVHEQEQIEDKQLLLNESWQHYCDRYDGGHEVERNQLRQKWVTETWEEYENRLPKREANIQRFFRRQAAHEEAAAKEIARQEENTERLLKEIKQREDRRRARLLPTLHTLVYDPEKEEKERNRQEQQEILKRERSHRRMIEADEFQAWHQLLRDEHKQRLWLIAELERRKKEEEEARRRKEEEDRRRKEEEEAERKRLEEEERRKIQEEANRQKEEAARKRKELEERRKAEQLRMKEERDKQRKAEEEAERRRKALEEEERRKKEDSEAADASAQFTEQWQEARKQQGKNMTDFLAILTEKVDKAGDADAMEAVMAWAVKEMGSMMSSFGMYIGLWDPADKKRLVYKHVADTCSAKMKAGDCSLHAETNKSCPTVATVLGMMEEVFVDDVNSVEDIVFMGDGALVAGPAREGDYMGLPLMKTTADGTHAVGVLGADTLTNNGGRDDWQNSHPVPDPNPRKLDDEEKQFLRDVAKILSAGLSRVWPEEIEEVAGDAAGDTDLSDLKALKGGDSNLGKIMQTGLQAIAKYLNDNGMNAYIAMPDRPQELLSVVYQFAGGKMYGSKDANPGEHQLGRHSFMIGKQLASVNKPLSFGLFGEEAKPYLYCEDVSKSDNVELYDGDGTKQEDCLLVAAIGGKAGSAPFAILGVEAPADPGLSQEQIDAIVKIATMLSDLISPMLSKIQTAGVCKQALQWLQATTGVQNVYISVPDGDNLRYIAGNKGNEFLVGLQLTPSEGLSHGVWEAEDGQVFIEDLKDNAENNGKVKFFKEDNKGKPGQCLFVGVKGQDGAQVAVLGCDTLGGKKTQLSNEDRKVVTRSAQLLADVFNEIAAGTLDDLSDDVTLDIEKVVGAGGVRFYKMVLIDVLAQLSGLTKDQLLEMARYNSPPELVVKVVSATLIVMQNKPKSVKEWDACRKHIKQPLIDKMQKFDATKAGKKTQEFLHPCKENAEGLGYGAGACQRVSPCEPLLPMVIRQHSVALRGRSAAEASQRRHPGPWG
uniref:Uncharacterized protein n=1 Tax=Eutreptiella gymnastica TaxID=73025 RepID=A0A7S4LEA9_9EUGL|mmetsp:Transcript_5955/g.10996  ORF Transcript_5955/g.10996 Transcript_5955/m.10996 type:complete len:1015 (+) Transcript_5955:41-3085(+)